QHTDERQTREIMALGEQLRADEDVTVAAPDVFERLPQRRAPACYVAIDSHHARAGEEPCDRFLDALRAAAHRAQVGVAAGRAVARHRVLRTAVVAPQA